ncbi:MAG: DNA polymerase III subunit beta [Oscillospiraceae bacterium]
MKIICDRTLLTDAISNASRAVSPKSAMPILEGVLLEASNDTLKITGYDLEMGISTIISCNVDVDGEIILSAKLFFDMIRKMPGNTVSIECNEKLLCTIKSGVTEYTILGLSTEEYPELPKISESEFIKIPKPILKSMISQTLFAIANTDSKPVHTGSMFDMEDGNLNIVSVDGFRLALRSEKIQNTESYNFIVPGKTLSEVEKMIDDEDEDVSIQISRKHIIFNVNDCKIVSRLLEGDFLDYKAAIPNTSTTTVKIPTRKFIDAIERTSLLISDKVKSPLKIKFADNMIKISCSTAIGKAYDEIQCEIIGEDVEMGFNSRFMLDALRASETDEIKLEINGPLSPMRIVSTQGDSFLFLVLPVRLKSE